MTATEGLILSTDGSVLSNQNMAKARCGFAAILCPMDHLVTNSIPVDGNPHNDVVSNEPWIGEPIAIVNEKVPVCTNQRSELLAIESGLQLAINHVRTQSPARFIVVLTDSQYCVKIFTAWYSVWKKKGIEKKHMELIELIVSRIKTLQLEHHISLYFSHIYSHTKNSSCPLVRLNAETDRLARKAAMS